MKNRMTEDSMALLGGALLGAAALYFLDPHRGARRRERVLGAARHLPDDARSAMKSGSRMAEGWFGRARGAYSNARDAAHDQAEEVGNNFASQARGRVAHLRDMGSHLWDRARGLVSHVPDLAAAQAQHLQDELADRTDPWRRLAARRVHQGAHRVQSWLGHEEHHGLGASTVVSSTVGAAALGAGVMYFFDPSRGKDRRAWAADKTMDCIHRTGKMMRTIGKDLSHRLGGAAADAESSARNFMSRAQIDSEQLVRRIRAELGRQPFGINQMQFMADGDGSVTVTGNVRPDDVDGLLTALHQIPGVEHVINRLVVNRSGEGRSGVISSSSQR